LRYFLKNWGTSEIFTHFSLTSFNLWMTACVSCFIADRRRGETSFSEFSLREEYFCIRRRFSMIELWQDTAFEGVRDSSFVGLLARFTTDPKRKILILFFLSGRQVESKLSIFTKWQSPENYCYSIFVFDFSVFFSQIFFLNRYLYFPSEIFLWKIVNYCWIIIFGVL